MIAFHRTNLLSIAGPTGYYAILAGTNILRRSTNYNGTPSGNPDPLDVTSGGEFQPSHTGMAIHIPGIGLNTSLGKDVSIIEAYIDARTVRIRDNAVSTITYAPLILLDGSVVSGTVLSCTISGSFTASPVTVAYTCTSSDTLASAAFHWAAAITANTTLRAARISAHTSGGSGTGASISNAAKTLIQVGNYNAHVLTVTTAATATPAAIVTPMGSVAQNGTTAQVGSLVGKTTVTYPCFQYADAGKGIYVSDGYFPLSDGCRDVFGEATAGAISRIIGIENAYTMFGGLGGHVNTAGCLLRIAGTPTAGDIITWTLYQPPTRGSCTVQPGDTVADIATNLAAAITRAGVPLLRAASLGSLVMVLHASFSSLAENMTFAGTDSTGTTAGTEILTYSDADLSYRISGSTTAGDTVNFTFRNPAGNPGFPVTASYTVRSGDTTTTVAAGVAAAINANPTLSAEGIVAFTNLSLTTNIYIACFFNGESLPGGIVISGSSSNAGSTGSGTEMVLNTTSPFSVASPRILRSGSKVVWGTDNIRNGAFANISRLLAVANPQMQSVYFPPGLAVGFNIVPQATPIGGLVGQAAIVGDGAKMYLFDHNAHLSFKTIGAQLLGNPLPPIKAIVGRIHLKRTAQAASPVVCIIGKSVETPELSFGVGSGAMTNSPNAVVEYSLQSNNPGKKFTFVNRAVAGGHAVGLNAVIAGPEWYSDRYEPWLSYCSALPVPVDVNPAGTASPDLCLIGVDGSNDQMQFSPRAYIAAINKLLAFPQSNGYPPDLILYTCRPADDSASGGLIFHWRAYGREYPTTFIRSFAHAAGYGYYDLHGYGSTVMRGWDPFRLAFQATPDLPPATLSEAVPYQVGGWRRRDYALKMLFTAGSFAAAWASVGQMTFRLSPKPDNVAVVDVAQPKLIIGGTPRDWDVISIAIAGAYAGSPQTVAYTVRSADTLTTIASAIAAAIKANRTLSAAGISATAWNAVVTLANANLTQYSSITPTITPSSHTETVTVYPSDAGQYLRLAEVRSYGAYASSTISGGGTSTLTSSGHSQSIAAVVQSSNVAEGQNKVRFATLPRNLAAGQYLTLGSLGEVDNAAPNVTLTGTVTEGDTISLTVTNLLVNRGTAVTVSYTATGSDTLTTVAAALVAAINDNGALSAALIKSSSSGTVITFSASSSSSFNGNRNFIALNLSASVAGAQTEVVKIAADPKYGSHFRTVVTRLLLPPYEECQTADVPWIGPASFSVPAYQYNQITWGGVLFHPLDAETQADLLIRDPMTNNVLYKGNVTAYHSQFCVGVSPALPEDLPSNALVFVGRLCAYEVMTSFDVNASRSANLSNPAIEFGIKGNTMSLGVFLKTASGSIYPFQYNAGRPLLTMQVEKFGGPFIPYITISGGIGGAGTILAQGVQHWVDDIVPDKPILTPWQMTGTGVNVGGTIPGGVHGGDGGKHPSSLQVRAVDMALAEKQDWFLT